MRKHKGFSLLIVLLLSLVGMAVVGVTLDAANRSSGAGRVTTRSGDAYNILQSEIEKARAALKAEMSSRKDPIKYGGGNIDSLEDITVLKDDHTPFWLFSYSDDVMKGNVSVGIYDMNYSLDSVVSGAVPAGLPPRVKPPAKSAGVYLIRAVFTFESGITNKIDVAVIQNSNPGV